jgi:peptidoglycan/xylan/chitin deacetylase (PgdA/CDA1 family)
MNPFVSIKKEDQKIPVLMYHSISENDDNNIPAYYRQNTHPDKFDEQLSLLRDNGYETIDLDLLLASEANLLKPDSKYVVLSFDDGFENFYANAYPIIKKYNMTAIVFIISSKVGRTFKDRKCMNWDQIGELKREGISIGSHTVSHPNLYSLSIPEIEAELLNSKSDLEDKLGFAIDHFAYPYAFPENDQFYVNQIEEILHKIGYKSCLTTIIGRAERFGQYFLKRLPVNSADDRRFFKAKLNGAYDWLQLLQYASKKLKKMRS